MSTRTCCFQNAVLLQAVSLNLLLITLLFCTTAQVFAAEIAAEASVSEENNRVDLASPALNIDEFDQDLIQPVSAFSCDTYDLDNPYGECRKQRWIDCWDGRFEIGLNGAEGNSRNLNIVFGFDAKREMGLNTITHDVDYLFSRDEDEITKDRFYSLSRFEHDIPNSNWGWFADKWFEYDGLEDFRARLGLHVGGVVTLVKTEKCLFKGLLGLGTSKEFAGSDQAWKPEAFLGSIWEKTINDRQNFYVRSVLYPDVAEFGSYRINVRGGWECALNEEKDLKLSLSAFDRYDSTPSGGDRRNDVDYWASLLWEF